MHPPTVADVRDHRAPGRAYDAPAGRNSDQAGGGPGGDPLQDEPAPRFRFGRPSPRLEALLVGVVVLLYHHFRRMPRWLTFPGSFNDDGVYLALGRALAEGLGYRSVHLAGEPVQLKYPPGLPALLAVLWRGTGSLDGVVTVARLLNLLLVGAAAALFWWIARRRLSLPPVLAALAVVPLLLEESLQYWSLVLAEPYVVLGWAVALLLALRMLDAERDSSVRAGVALGVLLAAVALFRTQAAVLLPAFVLVLADVRRTRRAAAACLAVGALPLVGWALYKSALRRAGPVSTLPDETSYSAWLPIGQPDQWGDFLASMLTSNVTYYGQAFGRLTTGSISGWPVMALFVLAAVAGGASRDRRRLIIAVPVLAVATTVIFWPWLQARLALPLLPAAGLLAGVALARLGERLPRRARVASGVGLAAALVSVPFVQARVRADTLDGILTGKYPGAWLAGDYLPSQSRLLALTAEWVDANTRPDEVVMFDLPAGLFLLTGRKVSHASPAESRFAMTVHAVAGRYLAERLIADRASVLVVPFEKLFIGRDVRAIVRLCPGALRLVHTFPPQGYPAIYRLAASPATDACLHAVRDGRHLAR